MEIILNNRSGKPIYEQITDQIRDQIADGSLKREEMLPSIRALAKDLKISVITTKRAYEELERQGYIYTVAGKGCFVAQLDGDTLKREYTHKIRDLAGEIRALGTSCGMDHDEILDLVDEVLKK